MNELELHALIADHRRDMHATLSAALCVLLGRRWVTEPDVTEGT